MATLRAARPRAGSNLRASSSSPLWQAGESPGFPAKTASGAPASPDGVGRAVPDPGIRRKTPRGNDLRASLKRTRPGPTGAPERKSLAPYDLRRSTQTGRRFTKMVKPSDTGIPCRVGRASGREPPSGCSSLRRVPTDRHAAEPRSAVASRVWKTVTSLAGETFSHACEAIREHRVVCRHHGRGACLS